MTSSNSLFDETPPQEEIHNHKVIQKLQNLFLFKCKATLRIEHTSQSVTGLLYV